MSFGRIIKFLFNQFPIHQPNSCRNESNPENGWQFQADFKIKAKTDIENSFSPIESKESKGQFKFKNKCIIEE